MSQSSNSPFGTTKSNPHPVAYINSRVNQYTEIDAYFLSGIQIKNDDKRAVSAIDFARHLHNRITLSYNDRRAYALEYFLGGYRCSNAAFVMNDLKVVNGRSTLYVLCFSNAIMTHRFSFDNTLEFIGLIQNRHVYCSIIILKESSLIS